MNIFKNLKLISLMAFSILISIYFLNFNNIAEADANISWTTTNVKLSFKKATITGYFKNSGDRGANITEIRLVLDAKTSKDGSPIWSDVATFYPNGTRFVPAGGRLNYTFNITNEGCPEWNSYFWWYVSYSNLRWSY